MKAIIRPVTPAFFALAIVCLIVVGGAGFAQAVMTASVDGTVTAMTQSTLTVTAADGSSKTAFLFPSTLVLERRTAMLADIKKGDAMGVTAHRAEGGVLTATAINVFSAELWKVVRKGQFPMQQPGQIMTNALVTSYDAKASGHTLSMTFGTLTTTINVPEGTDIHRLVTVKLSAVKKGMHVLVRGSAERQRNQGFDRQLRRVPGLARPKAERKGPQGGSRWSAEGAKRREPWGTYSCHLPCIIGPRAKNDTVSHGGHSLKYRSIRVKLLFYFVAVIVLPLLTLGILGPFISARIIENEVTNHTVQLIRQVTRNIEFYIREMEGIISILAEDSNIQDFYGIGGTPLDSRGRERRAPSASCTTSRT